MDEDAEEAEEMIAGVEIDDNPKDVVE